MPNETSSASCIFRFIKFNWLLVPLPFFTFFLVQKCSLASALGKFCRWSESKVKLKDLITSKALNWLYVLMPETLSLYNHKKWLGNEYEKFYNRLSQQCFISCLNKNLPIGQFCNNLATVKNSFSSHQLKAVRLKAIFTSKFTVHFNWFALIF